jgi:D-3-phosphoglycerate dehydrogenase
MNTTSTPTSNRVLLTDHAWPETRIEQRILADAGYELVCGPAVAASATHIEELVAAHDPVAIMTCWAQVSATAIGTPTDLRVVARMGVGLDNIDIDAATDRGAWVTNVPDYCVDEVSDHAVALVLDWSRGITAFDRAAKAGHWDPASARLRRLGEKTVGIIGFGRIGRTTARKLAGFGCRILVHDPHAEPAPEVEPVGLDELLAESDVVILHAPLTPQTHHLIDGRRFALLREDALLVNVSRGGLVDTGALVAALQRGDLAHVALDVLEEEPEVPTRLREQPGVVITPHVAFSSDASVAELRTKAAEEVVRVLAGTAPRCPCNPPALLAPTLEEAR